MTYKIEFDIAAKKELNKLDRQVAVRILKFLNDRLANADDPRSLGESLKRRFEEYWKYRIGDYRIICIILDKIVTVVVVKIGNRREVYKLK
jgi:mRNA interferase RelE/StbE